MIQSSSRRDQMLRLMMRPTLGIRLVSDIHERACDLGVALRPGAKRRARVKRISDVGLLFVHVPKTAGMSIAQTLYGEQIGHASIRLWRRVADGRLATIPSFAVIRDPAERFLSSYRYARANGTADNDVGEPFRSLYARFRTVDDALDHVAAATSPYRVDHLFRPQSWYVSDAKGRIAVDRLIALDDLDRIATLLPGFPRRPVPRINRSTGHVDPLTARQRARLTMLYADDYALWDRVATEHMPMH